MPRTNNALGVRVPEDVACASNMTEEETAPGDIGILGADIIRDMGIGKGGGSQPLVDDHRRPQKGSCH